MDPFTDGSRLGHRKLATYGKRGRRIIQIDQRKDIFEPNISTEDLFGESDKSISPDKDFETKKSSRLISKSQSSVKQKENQIFKRTRRKQKETESIDSSPQSEPSLKLYDSVEDNKQTENPSQLCVTKKPCAKKNVGKKKNCLRVKKKPVRKKQRKFEHESVSSQDSCDKYEKSRHFSEFDSYDLKLESSGADVFESPVTTTSVNNKQSNQAEKCKQIYNTSTPQHQDPAPISNLEENINHELSFIKPDSPSDADGISYIDIIEESARDSGVFQSVHNSTNDRNTPDVLQEISSRLSQLNRMNSSTSLFEKNASQNVHECSSKGIENDSKLANIIEEAPFVNKKRTRNVSKKYTVPIEESHMFDTAEIIMIEEEKCEEGEKKSLSDRLSNETYTLTTKCCASKTDYESPPRPKSPSLCTNQDPFKTPISTMKTRNRILEELKMSSQSFQEILTPKRSKISGHVFTAMEKVLSQCEVNEPSTFGDCFTSSMYRNLKKIGEGVYGEVFKTERNRVSVAMKVIPIEGDFPVNDEPQKSFEEILPEIVITKELSNLSSSKHNCTNNFVHVNKVWLVRGKYPPAILKQWDAFHERKTSENDRPDIFKDDQLFIIFEFENAGDTLEGFEFQNFETSRSILNQVTLALTVAESELSFEHRDLHWGNVLIKETKEQYISFIVEGKTIDVETKGVRATIIDFTLSRLSKDNCSVFTDLSADPMLFEGKGDYQFEVYRLMQSKIGDNWSSYHAYTNVLWIHYLGDKLLRSKNYKERIQTDAREFRTLARQATDYNSATDLISNCPFFQKSEDIIFH